MASERNKCHTCWTKLPVMVLGIVSLLVGSVVEAATNKPPVASAIKAVAKEDVKRLIVLKGVDPEQKKLRYLIVRQPTHGQLKLTGSKVVYSPATNYFGADSFTYKVNDGEKDSKPARVSITVKPINDPPVGKSLSVKGVMGTPQDISLSGTDVDGVDLAYLPALRTVKGGRVVLKDANTVTFIPKLGYVGTDSFMFRVKDDHGALSQSATVSINIGACPLPDPSDGKGGYVKGLGCLDRARLQYFRARVEPWLRQQMTADFEQVKIVEESYTEEAVEKAIDSSPFTSAIQSFESFWDMVDDAQEGKFIKVTADTAQFVLKTIETVVNTIAYSDNVLGLDIPDNYEEAAALLAKTNDIHEAIMGALDAPECFGVLLDEKKTDVKACIEVLSTALDKLPYFESLDSDSRKKIKATFSSMISILKASNSIAHFPAFPKKANKSEYMRKVFGLATSLHKMTTDAVELIFVNKGKEVPKSGWSGLIIGIYKDVGVPLELLSSCYGVDGRTNIVTRMKCYGDIASALNKQAVRATVALIGNIQMLRTMSNMNDSIVTQKVLEKFLMTGSYNYRKVYSEYGVAYGGNDFWDFIYFGELIDKIGKREFGFDGVHDYGLWYGLWFFDVGGVILSGKPFSVGKVRSDVSLYYSRIEREAFIDANSPLMYLFSDVDDKGLANIAIELDAVNVKKYGKLVCYSDDNSSYPMEKPWSSGVLWSNAAISFNIQLDKSGKHAVMCNLYNSRSIYQGSKTIIVQVDRSDSDKDGMTNEWEAAHGLDPYNPADAGGDMDGDGLTNLEEFENNTDPNKTDSDGDGYNDKQEVESGTNPLDASDYPNSSPQNLIAVAGDASVTLSWDSVPNATGYRVCLSHVFSGDDSKVNNCSPSTIEWGALENWWDVTEETSITLTTLPDGQPFVNGVDYGFVVIALNASGNMSPASNEVSVSFSSTQIKYQSENSFEVFEDGITDLVETPSFVSRDLKYVYVGTTNGKLISFDANTLRPISKVLLDTGSFRHVDASIDYIKQVGDKLFVAVTVDPQSKSRLNNGDLGSYFLEYDLMAGAIVKLVGVNKMYTAPAHYYQGKVTGIHFWDNYLYMSMDGSIRVYEVIANGFKETPASKWIYGGAKQLCGFGDKLYASANGQIHRYSANGGSFVDDEKTIQGNDLLCSDDLIFTNEGIFDKDMNSLASLKDMGYEYDIKSLSVVDDVAYFSTYYAKDFSSCNIKELSVGLHDFSVNYSDKKIKDANLISDYTTDCPYNTSMGSVYKTRNGYSNVLMSVASPDQAINFQDNLGLQSLYSFNANYVEMEQYGGSIYILLLNKVIRVDPVSHTYDVVLESDNLLSDFWSFAIKDGKLIVSRFNSDSDGNNLYKYELNSDGVSAYKLDSGNVGSRWGGGGHLNICDGSIFTSKSIYSMGIWVDVMATIDLQTMKPSANTISLSSPVFCHDEVPYIMYNSGGYSAVYRLFKEVSSDGSTVWTSTYEPPFSINATYFPIWPNDDDVIFYNHADGSVMAVNLASGLARTASPGIDVPFLATRTSTNLLEYDFFDKWGQFEKKVTSPCQFYPSVYDPSHVLDGYLWLPRGNPDGSGLCMVPQKQ